MRNELRCILALTMVLLFVGAVYAEDNEYQKKIEQETGTPVANTRALDCTGAVDITCGQTVNGSNVGLPNGVNTYYGCTWNEAGGEKVYRLVLTSATRVTATLSNMTVDLDVFLLSACDANNCLTFGNSTWTSTCLNPGTYYIVVDGYNGASGAFTLAVTCVSCAPPPNDVCETAIDLCSGGGGAFNVGYNSTFAYNNYQLAFGNPCTGYPSIGLDVVYKICLAPGGSIDVTQTGTIDMSLYLVTDCANVATSCVAGSDVCCTGAAEHIAYTSAAGGTYFLIVDGYSSTGTVGTIYGTITGCCGTAAQEGSWASVKELFR